MNEDEKPRLLHKELFMKKNEANNDGAPLLPHQQFGSHGGLPKDEKFHDHATSNDVEKYDDSLKVVPFSKLGIAPETRRWYKIPVTILLALFSLVSMIILILLAPMIFLCSLAQRLHVRRLKYHTDPSKVQIAVIGGGWSALQCIDRLQELGVSPNNIKGFERHDSWGGTWHPKQRYHTIQVHGAMWITAFKNFPYSSNQDINDGKIDGEEMEKYINLFGNKKKLQNIYAFDSRVVEIEYAFNTRIATLVVENSKGEQRTEGPFDFVIYASQASEPSIPNLPGKEKYEGEVYHTINFKNDQYQDIVNNNKKVIVVGGSKSGCDLALCFQRSAYKNYQWLHRKAYLFWKYEVMFHDRSFYNVLRGATTILGMILSLISTQLGGVIFWASGIATTYGEPHNDWKRFHFGIICPRQRHDLAQIPKEQIIHGNPMEFTTKGLRLEDGTNVPSNVVLFATGYQSGIDKIHLVKDGTTFNFNPSTKMLDHFIFPDYPVLANSTALWTTFGPVRAMNSAEMAIYHLCVRKKMTEQEMNNSAWWQFGGSTNSVSSFLFQSKQSSAIISFMTIHLDLLFRGYVNILDFLLHSIEVFCLSRQSPLVMSMLPKVNHNN